MTISPRFLLPLLAVLLLSPLTLFAESDDKEKDEEVEIPTDAFSVPPDEKRDPFADPLIQKVHKRHLKGVEGDKDEVKNLMKDLEKMTKEQPDNHLLLAYLGSVYTLRSRDVWFPPQDKLKYLKMGGKTMDEAVDKAPDNVAVRFIRGVNYISLPAIFGKRDEAREDFKIIYKTLRAGQAPPLDKRTKQAMFYYTGLSYYQERKYELAKRVLNEAKEVSDNELWHKKIDKLLKKVESNQKGSTVEQRHLKS